jgi:hypothetical protein
MAIYPKELSYLPNNPKPVSKKTPCSYKVFEIAGISLDNSKAETLYYVAGKRDSTNGTVLLASKDRLLEGDTIPCDYPIRLTSITSYRAIKD